MSVLLAKNKAVARQHRDTYLTISLEPSERAVLHARIAQRFDAMLALGFVDEVRRLHARGDLHLGLSALRCVGYRQLWAYVDGHIDLERAREHSLAATRQLAKRQMTWLHAQPDRIIVDCLARNAIARSIDAVAQALA
jgi:tRNA dimethylallyltransferase